MDDDKPVEHDYASSSVRDLAWAIFSPPMVSVVDTPGGTASAPAFALTPARQRWLAALDADPSPLLAYLASSQSRFLGVYFEALWRFFLSRDDDVTLLASNHQVVDNGRTIGEFDMFYHCHRRNAVVHLELAVKFYLGMPIETDSDLRQARFWLGPNCIDRLDLKINHLRDHQLPLIDHASAQAWLQKKNLLPAIQEVAMHGYLYYPASQGIDANIMDQGPEDADDNHLRSFWIRDQQLVRSRPTDTRQKRYRIVPRLQWLCTHDTPDNEWMTYEVFMKNVQEELSTALIQPILCEETTLDATLGRRRFFVAPQDWPALHWPRRKF